MDYIQTSIEKYGLTIEQYEKCLKDVFNKVNGINDMDWSEIICKYNLDIHYDTLRKASQTIFGGAFVYEYFKNKNAESYENDKYLSEIKNQKLELEIERQKLYATKIEYARQIRHQSRFKLFYENIKNEIRTLDIPKFEKLSVSNEDKEYVLTIADIHAGANFDIGVNKYSLEECTRRFEYLINHMINYILNNKISKLKILELGDDIQGILRITDLQLNETSVVEATVYVAKTIAEFLNELSKYCEIEYYHCPTSNHSQTRNLGTKASELASEDVEYIIGNYIKDVLGDNNRINIYTNFGQEYIEIPIFDFNSIAFHGHQFKSTDTALKDISFQNKKFYDYLFIAHFHASEEKNSGEFNDNDIETLICPSFIGTCPYAKKIMKGAKSACKIFVFDEKYGHTDTHKIILN